MVGLLEAGEGEGAGDEEAGGGRGDGGWLMGVEGAAVVLWRSEAVAVRRFCQIWRRWEEDLGVRSWLWLTGWVVRVSPVVCFWLWDRMP